MQWAFFSFSFTWRSKGQCSPSPCHVFVLVPFDQVINNLVLRRTFCDTTMYLYVSEIFPTEIRPIGMGFSLFGQFAATIILLQTAPIGIVNVGWKYYLVIICWCIFFIPIVYFYFPETAQLSLEEIGQRFGDDVAVHINDATEEQRQELDSYLKEKDLTQYWAQAATEVEDVTEAV